MHLSRIPDTYSLKETLRTLNIYINRAHCAFQFRELLSNVWNLEQFSAKTIIILVINFGLESAIFNVVWGLFIWADVILVTEKTFRQVYKRDLVLL